MRISDWSSDVCSSDLAGRTVEKEALGRADAEAAERSGMLEGQFDALDHLVARRVEAADVAPARLGRLHHHLAHRRGLDALQGIVEILARHAELVEHLGRDRSFPGIEQSGKANV